jgi:DNA-directed RNA polymerase subunit RPC12/RpoP
MTSVTQKVSESIEKVSEIFCEKCGYKTNVKSNFNKHCRTARHLNVTLVTPPVTESIEKVSEGTGQYKCSGCSKSYSSRNGLWCHQKKCSKDTSKQISPDTAEPVIDTTLVLELIKQNKELQQFLVQQSKEKTDLINKLVEREPGTNTINSNNTTNNNQKFNLNFFLNETCKDAMNIQEFVENIRITFQDLLKIGDNGFVNGVSDIFIKELRDLEVNKRPIHCTDAKRETIYLKENDVWNKDDKDNKRLKDVIEKIEYKNAAALRQWCQDNPDSKTNNTPNNLLRDKIYMQTLQGDETTREKIIKNISKEVVVEK